MALLVLGPQRLPGYSQYTGYCAQDGTSCIWFLTEMEEQLRIHELHENLCKAEEQGLENPDPELQKSVYELKAAAQSVQQPYKSLSTKPRRAQAR